MPTSQLPSLNGSVGWARGTTGRAVDAKDSGECLTILDPPAVVTATPGSSASHARRPAAQALLDTRQEGHVDILQRPSRPLSESARGKQSKKRASGNKPSNWKELINSLPPSPHPPFGDVERHRRFAQQQHEQNLLSGSEDASGRDDDSALEAGVQQDAGLAASDDNLRPDLRADLRAAMERALQLANEDSISAITGDDEAATADARRLEQRRAAVQALQMAQDAGLAVELPTHPTESATASEPAALELQQQEQRLVMESPLQQARDEGCAESVQARERDTPTAIAEEERLARRSRDDELVARRLQQQCSDEHDALKRQRRTISLTQANKASTLQLPSLNGSVGWARGTTGRAVDAKDSGECHTILDPPAVTAVAPVKSSSHERRPLAQAPDEQSTRQLPQGCRLLEIETASAPASHQPGGGGGLALAIENEMNRSGTWGDKADSLDDSLPALPSAQHTHKDDSPDQAAPDLTSVVAAHACSACGALTNIVFCDDEPFCNNRVGTRLSCAVSFLSARPGAVLRVQHERWGICRIVCNVSACTDVHRLAAVCTEGSGPAPSYTQADADARTGHPVTVLRVDLAAALQPDSAPHPVIEQGVLAGWLCGTNGAETYAAAASVYQERSRRRAWLQKPVASPSRYANVAEYYKHFQPLLTIVAEDEDRLNRHRCVYDLNGTWRDGLEGPELVVAAPRHTSLPFREGEQVRLSCSRMPVFDTDGVRDSSNEWTAVGNVLDTSETTIVIALAFCSGAGGLTAVDRTVVSDFAIRPKALTVALDRLHTALFAFAIDEVTGCSPHLTQALLGFTHAHPIACVNETEVSGKLNLSQKRAVVASLTLPLLRVIGPPGTGKTDTATAIVQSLVAQEQGQVLVCAPSNVAADNLALRLGEVGLCVVRHMASSAERSRASLPEKLQAPYFMEQPAELSALRRIRDELGQLTSHDEARYNKLRRKQLRDALRQPEVVVCTCMAAGDTALSGCRFDFIVVDEAGQAVELEVLVPATLGACRLILIGDDKQLGPLVTSERAKAGGWGVSLFSRLGSCAVPSVLLDTQYRMHPALARFPSEEFYGGNIQDGVTAQQRTARDVSFPWPDATQPHFFWHTAAQEMLGGRRGNSYYNPTEAAAVCSAVVRLLREGATHADVGVIATYDEQRVVIDRLLRASVADGTIEVANVDGFQGRQMRFIVLSLTRSNATGARGGGKIGYLSEAPRVNVALTRAMCGLVVVGDALTFQHDSMWRRYLRHMGPLVVTGELDSMLPFVLNLSASSDSAALTLAAFAAEFVAPDQCCVSPPLVRGETDLSVYHLPRKLESAQRRALGAYLTHSARTGTTPSRFIERRILDGLRRPQPADVAFPSLRPVASFFINSSPLQIPAPDRDERVASLPSLDVDDPGQDACVASSRVAALRAFVQNLLQRGVCGPTVQVAAVNRFGDLVPPDIDLSSTLARPSQVGDELSLSAGPGGVEKRGGTDDSNHDAHTIWRLPSTVQPRHETPRLPSRAELDLEGSVCMAVDLYPEEDRDRMVTMLHDANTSSVSLLRAEREIFTSSGRVLTISVEHHMRMVQFWWRACIVGHMNGEARSKYWSLVHSTRRDRHALFRAHVAAHRRDRPLYQGHAALLSTRDEVLQKATRQQDTVWEELTGEAIVARVWWYNTVTRCTERLTPPIISIVGRFMLVDGSTAGQSVVGSPSTLPRLNAQYFNGTLVVLPARALSTVDGTEPRRNVRGERASSWGSSEFDFTGPRYFLQRYRPYRQMHCGFGVHECLRTVWLNGRPVRGPDGQPVRRRYMATRADFAEQQRRARIVIAWYQRDVAVLRAVLGDVMLLLPYGNPGGHSEGARRAGFHGVLTDIETQDARRWFHDLAPTIYGADAPSIVVNEGDALQTAVRSRAETMHPLLPVLVGTYATPPCRRYTNLAHLTAAAQQRQSDNSTPVPVRGDMGVAGKRNECLSAEVALNQEAYEHRGLPYFVEGTSGTPFAAPEGVVAVKNSELAYGCALTGEHLTYSPARHPFYVDRVLTLGGDWLAERTCPGGARPLPPPQRAGGGPQPKCCTGNIAPGHNNGYLVYSKRFLVGEYGLHIDHVSSKGRLMNALPSIMGEHQAAELASHSTNIRFNIPFVPHDHAVDDPRLGAWRMLLQDRITLTGRTPPPVQRVVLVCAPVNVAGTLLVDSLGRLPCVSVPSDGVFVHEVAAALTSAYPGILFSHTHLSFVCDLLHNDIGANVVVFFSQIVACSDAHFIKKRSFASREAGAGKAGKKFSSNTRPLGAVEEEGDALLFAAPLEETVVRLAKPNKTKWVGVEQAALREAFSASLLKLSDTLPPLLVQPSSVQSLVAITSQSIERCKHFLEHGVDIDTAGTDSAQAPVSNLAVSSLRVATSRGNGSKAGASTWEPPADAFFNRSSPDSSTAHEATVAAAEPTGRLHGGELKEQYIELRSKLLGNVSPSKYGLGGDQADRIGQAHSTRPRPVTVEAVGFCLKWRGEAIIASVDEERVGLFQKAAGSYPSGSRRGAQTVWRSDLRSIAAQWFGGYTIFDRIVTAINSLKFEEQHEVAEWIIDSRDAFGHLSSSSVPARHVVMHVWQVLVADEETWSLQVHPTQSQSTGTQVYLPTTDHAGRRSSERLVPESAALFAANLTPLAFAPDRTSLRLWQVSFEQLASELRRIHRVEVAVALLKLALPPADAALAEVNLLEPPAHSNDTEGRLFDFTLLQWPSLQSLQGKLRRATRHLHTCTSVDATQLSVSVRRLHEVQLADAHTSRMSALLDLAGARGASFLYGQYWNAVQAHTDRRWSRAIELYCREIDMVDIIRGRKTVLCLLFRRGYANVTTKTCLLLRGSPETLGTWASVARIWRHDSFTTAARTHGRSLLPRHDVGSMSDIQIEHHFFSMQGRQHIHGLNNWCISTQAPGCVVCWEIELQPPGACVAHPTRARFHVNPEQDSLAQLNRGFSVLRLRRAWRLLCVRARAVYLAAPLLARELVRSSSFRSTICTGASSPPGYGSSSSSSNDESSASSSDADNESSDSLLSPRSARPTSQAPELRQSHETSVAAASGLPEAVQHLGLQETVSAAGTAVVGAPSPATVSNPPARSDPASPSSDEYAPGDVAQNTSSSEPVGVAPTYEESGICSRRQLELDAVLTIQAQWQALTSRRVARQQRIVARLFSDTLKEEYMQQYAASTVISRAWLLLQKRRARSLARTKAVAAYISQRVAEQIVSNVLANLPARSDRRLVDDNAAAALRILCLLRLARTRKRIQNRLDVRSLCLEISQGMVLAALRPLPHCSATPGFVESEHQFATQSVDDVHHLSLEADSIGPASVGDGSCSSIIAPDVAFDAIASAEATACLRAATAATVEPPGRVVCTLSVSKSGLVSCPLRLARLEHCVRPRGVIDESLDGLIDYIFHPVNCLDKPGVWGREQVAVRFPFCSTTQQPRSVQERGEPGTLSEFKDELRELTASPIILNAHVQWSGEQARKVDKAPGRVADGPEERLSWFCQCLSSLANLKRGSVIAFPWGLGCWGVDGASTSMGDWIRTRRALSKFAKHNPHLRLVVVQRTVDARRAHAQRVEKEFNDLDAQSIEKGKDDPALTRELCKAWRSLIREQVTASLPDSFSRASVRSAISTAMAGRISADFASCQADIDKARADKREEVEACNVLFRKQIKRDLAAGDVSHAAAVEALDAVTVAHLPVHARQSSGRRSVTIVGLVNNPQYNGVTGVITKRESNHFQVTLDERVKLVQGGFTSTLRVPAHCVVSSDSAEALNVMQRL